MSSEIYSDNIVMATTEEVQADACKALEEHRSVVEECMKAAEEKDLQEFIACFKRDRQRLVTEVKQAILLSINNTAKVTPNVGTSSPSVSYEDVSNMFVHHCKIMINQMQQMILDSIAKSFTNLNILSHSPVAHVNQHA
jgi:hypothetical protein